MNFIMKYSIQFLLQPINRPLVSGDSFADLLLANLEIEASHQRGPPPDLEVMAGNRQYTCGFMRIGIMLCFTSYVLT